jgi:hypothetical protein
LKLVWISGDIYTGGLGANGLMRCLLACGSAKIQASCWPGVLAARDDGRFEELATVARESFDVEDNQRHNAQL